MAKGESLKTAAAEALKTLTDASSLALKTIADAAQNASRVISQNASTAASALNVSSSGDHDAIIALMSSVSDLNRNNNEKFADLKADIKELKDGTASKIDSHEARLNIIENKITKIFTFGTAGLIVLGLVEFFLAKLWK